MRLKTFILGCSVFLVGACATEKDVGVIDQNDKVKDRATAIFLGIAACKQTAPGTPTDTSLWRARLDNDTWYVWQEVNEYGRRIERCEGGSFHIRIAKRDGQSLGCEVCVTMS